MTQLNKRVGQVFTPIKKGGANFLNLTPPNLRFFVIYPTLNGALQLLLRQHYLL